MAHRTSWFLMIYLIKTQWLSIATLNSQRGGDIYIYILILCIYIYITHLKFTTCCRIVAICFAVAPQEPWLARCDLCRKAKDRCVMTQPAGGWHENDRDGHLMAMTFLEIYWKAIWNIWNIWNILDILDVLILVAEAPVMGNEVSTPQCWDILKNVTVSLWRNLGWSDLEGVDP